MKSIQDVTRQLLKPLSVCSGGLMLCVSPHLIASNQVKGYVIWVQLTPAICHLDTTKAKKRKCLEGYSLNIVGLYPETNKINCQTKSSPQLAPLQARAIARVMPDETARVHLWQSIGGCVDMNASQYFRTIINTADRLNIPPEASSSETLQMSAVKMRQRFLQLNPKMPSHSIHFQCQTRRNQSFLTDVKVCYTPTGGYKACPSDVRSNCPANFHVKGAY